MKKAFYFEWMMRELEFLVPQKSPISEAVKESMCLCKCICVCVYVCVCVVVRAGVLMCVLPVSVCGFSFVCESENGFVNALFCLWYVNVLLSVACVCK